MRKVYLAIPAALSAAMLTLWTGCASKQPQAASGDGGTNLAYMAEGAPIISSAGGAAPSTAPGAMPSIASSAPQESFAYTVQTGDSLWKIANKYGTSVSLIQKMNNMPPDKITIRVGDKITIPGKADADRLRQQPSSPTTSSVTPVPTVTVPTTSASTRFTVTPPTVTAPTAKTPTITAPTVTAPTVTAPSATAPTASGGASWLPPSYRTPQTGAATTPGVATTPPSLSISPGAATLSPGAVNTTPSSPPPASLTLTPGTVTTPVGGMTIQAVGPTGAPPTTPPAVPPTTP